ncbi:hypothetical protein [Bifidobacterium adolescentis]|uniref:hypothetical protein n=1 Tax=Bifidobacterium adolescentis TaxID=1680 RepID=UPI0011C3BF79|nr:hypothetical protein [Bifidobacterium adolescentis]
MWLNEMPHPCLADGVFLIIAVPKGGTPHNPAFLQVQPERPKVAADVRNRNISGGSATLRRQTCGAEEQAETAIARTPYEALTCALICGGDSRKHNG